MCVHARACNICSSAEGSTEHPGLYCVFCGYALIFLEKHFGSQEDFSVILPVCFVACNANGRTGGSGSHILLSRRIQAGTEWWWFEGNKNFAIQLNKFRRASLSYAVSSLGYGVRREATEEESRGWRKAEVDGKVHTWRGREGGSFNRPLLCAGDIFPGHYCI